MEIRHKEIKLPVLSTLGYADKVSAQEGSEAALRESWELALVATGEGREAAPGVNEAALSSAKAESAAKLTAFLMSISVKNLNELP